MGAVNHPAQPIETGSGWLGGKPSCGHRISRKHGLDPRIALSSGGSKTCFIAVGGIPA